MTHSLLNCYDCTEKLFYSIAAALVALFIGLFLHYRTKGIAPAPPDDIPITDTNMNRQCVYIAKLIERAASISECDCIEDYIKHFETTFIDSPDINIEVEEMRDALQMQRNYIEVMKLQTTVS